MNKNITICFRTSDNLRKAIEKIAEEERRSVSSAIENILYKYLENKNESKRLQEEKRRYPRKRVSVPALVSKLVQDDTTMQAGIVLDLSLGGLQISLPNNAQYEIQEDVKNSKISIVFTLPESKRPINIQCVPQHVYRSNGETNVGACFVDTDFLSYQALQSYLIN